MRLAPAALVLALACSTLAATAPTEAARGVRCGGSQVTIESSDRKVVGTEGRDVILATGSEIINGLGGDDVICVYGRGRSAEIHAGTGHDYVAIIAGDGRTYVTLGEGDDTFLGGDGHDVVRGSEAEFAGQDTLRTGKGDDSVWRVSGPDGDDVHLGPGDDHITLDSADSSAIVPSGGTGDDQILLGSLTSTGELVVDNIAQTASLGTVIARWDNFEHFTLLRGGATQRFIGTDDDETVHFEPGMVPTATMGAGDDEISLSSVTSAGSLDGGKGDGDRIGAAWFASPQDEFSGSLVAQKIAFTAFAGSGVLRFSGMEGLGISAPGTVTVRGDQRDNVLRAFGCVNTVKAAAGDDVVRIRGFWDDLNDDQCTPVSTVRGGAGSDELYGGSGKDVLRGDRGRDFADGRQDRDRCLAERERRCEH